MSDCLTFWVNPNDMGEGDNPPPENPPSCGGDCSCGYVQYESLIPYLKEINDALKTDPEKATELEFKLREKIVAISRLFDMEAGVEPGYFSKSHYQTTKLFATNGTRYIKIPPFVPGTLEVRTANNFLLNESLYAYSDGFLVYLPCMTHTSCSCSSSCGSKRTTQPQPWGDGCYYITARWGNECTDEAVKMAITDYLIEGYRVNDPVIVAATGLPVSRSFRAPHSWDAYITNFKAKRRVFSEFAIA